MVTSWQWQIRPSEAPFRPATCKASLWMPEQSVGREDPLLRSSISASNVQDECCRTSAIVHKGEELPWCCNISSFRTCS